MPDDARPGALIAFVIAIGVLLGLGGFTFRYAEGLSYFSSDPRACANCHLPHSCFAKYKAKASNGWHHSKGFTLQDFEEPIRITPANSAILQDNCLRCHEPMVHELVTGARTDRDAVECVHCHASVGHGERAGLGGPQRADER